MFMLLFQHLNLLIDCISTTENHFESAIEIYSDAFDHLSDSIIVIFYSAGFQLIKHIMWVGYFFLHLSFGSVGSVNCVQSGVPCRYLCRKIQEFILVFLQRNFFKKTDIHQRDDFLIQQPDYVLDLYSFRRSIRQPDGIRFDALIVSSNLIETSFVKRSIALTIAVCSSVSLTECEDRGRLLVFCAESTIF